MFHLVFNGQISVDTKATKRQQRDAIKRLKRCNKERHSEKYLDKHIMSSKVIVFVCFPYTPARKTLVELSLISVPDARSLNLIYARLTLKGQKSDHFEYLGGGAFRSEIPGAKTVHEIELLRKLLFLAFYF